MDHINETFSVFIKILKLFTIQNDVFVQKLPQVVKLNEIGFNSHFNLNDIKPT